MLKIRIIPCLDVHDGRIVKGVQFVDLVDAGDPVSVAKAYEQAGADELCFLDISASHEGRKTIIDIVRQVADQCFMPMTVGGGVSCVEDARNLLLAGADKVALNTAAINNPDCIYDISTKFGAQCVVVAMDVRKVDENRWEIFTHGGRTETKIEAVGFACDIVARGAGEILLTSMDRDGTKQGFDLDITRQISDAVSVPVVASGGVGNPMHFVEGIKQGHANAVLAASIFHFGEFTIKEAKRIMAEEGIPVRL